MAFLSKKKKSGLDTSESFCVVEKQDILGLSQPVVETEKQVFLCGPVLLNVTDWEWVGGRGNILIEGRVRGMGEGEPGKCITFEM